MTAVPLQVTFRNMDPSDAIETAIREKVDAPAARSWELKRTQTTCSYCGVGCQLDLWTHEGRIVKLMMAT